MTNICRNMYIFLKIRNSYFKFPGFVPLWTAHTAPLSIKKFFITVHSRDKGNVNGDHRERDPGRS